MDIKKSKLVICVVALLFLQVLLSGTLGAADKEISTDMTTHSDGKPKSSLVEWFDDGDELELPDKVYTFTPSQRNWTFRGIYLEQDYMYYIYIELVTPHNCSSMRITTWDPDDRRFKLFEKAMYYNPEEERSFEIRFGAVISGRYRFEFFVDTQMSFNLYIQMRQGDKILEDKMDQIDIDNKIYDKFITIEDGEQDSEDLDLKTDYMYKFYVGRVSEISDEFTNNIRLDCTIIDPDDTSFIIYQNDVLSNIGGVNIFQFGTAMAGEYEIVLRIYCPDEEYINVAYSVVEEYQISEVVDVNKTSPGGSSGSGDDDLIEDLHDEAISLPLEWTIGTLIFAGSLLGAAYIMVTQQRKGKLVSLPLRSKVKANKN